MCLGFITALLNNLGMHINPMRFIKVITQQQIIFISPRNSGFRLGCKSPACVTHLSNCCVTTVSRQIELIHTLTIIVPQVAISLECKTILATDSMTLITRLNKQQKSGLYVTPNTHECHDCKEAVASLGSKIQP